MENWIPLFDILMNSPCPEAQASLWLQHSYNPSSSSVSITTSSFLSLLTKPTLLHSDSDSDSSHSHTQRFMWIQTLPNVLQARLLSFLAFDHMRFCAFDLYKLANNFLTADDHHHQLLDFWVKTAARQLLDLVSHSNFDWVSGFSLDSDAHEEFEVFPDCLKQAVDCDSDIVLPWLPVLSHELNIGMPVDTFGIFYDDSLNAVEKIEDADFHKVASGVGFVHVSNDRVNPETENVAAILKSKILNSECAVELADEIRKLCDGPNVNSLAVLSLVEPWQADDETASLLISHFSNQSSQNLSWPSHVLCSILLPKLLQLEEPASRMLVTSTIEYCKMHQRSSVYALLYPLILRKNGINNPIGDVVARVVKECLHPAHVSSFCQKLLCGEDDAGKFVCLPCHQYLISDKLVWNEPLFSLFQTILNHNVLLTEDSVARLVYHVGQSAIRLRDSLKFGNFLLCLVNKCTPLIRSHKVSLIRAVEHTNTIVSKSLISKLTSL
ncbi:Fanconi anemia group E protein, C-terminal [Heracleum sosnowskyi]|uniref:Fanconi anemia group E protein, C-terminal n=1 Tax=Heracleum sosnowskyi TaxID=360622 RepID=A0AAD8IVA2_9APIA|nr:Fanconi anemia group E protein, C-terminal [Heracleum sosnowskyi]